MEKFIHILLIRHGEVEYPLDSEGRKVVYGPDTSLSSMGRRQIQQLSTRIKEEKFIPKAVFTSPFRRARETADILCHNLLWPSPTVTENLQDVHNPDWIGIPLEDYGKIGGDIYRDPKSPNQESLTQLTQRAKSALNEILDKIINKDSASIVLVSHGDLLSALHWGLIHTTAPPTYKVMKDNFYLLKGGAYQVVLDEQKRLVGKGKHILIQEVEQTRETWR